MEHHNEVLIDLEGATPAWLTGALRRSSSLSRGTVTAVEQEEVNSSSYVAHLRLSYSSDAPVSAPANLLLKVARPELEARMRQRNKREIALYRTTAGRDHGLPMVRCYDAAYRTSEVDHFHLLLGDPSATTHLAYPYSGVPPTILQCEMIVDTLAEVHAGCWETTIFNTAFQANRATEVHTGEVTDDLVPWIEETLARFLEDLGERIPSERQTLYESIGAAPARAMFHREKPGSTLPQLQGVP